MASIVLTCIIFSIQNQVYFIFFNEKSKAAYRKHQVHNSLHHHKYIHQYLFHCYRNHCEPMQHYHKLELGKRRIMFRNWRIRSQHVEADLNKNSHSGLKTTTESTLYGLLSLTCCIVFQSESSCSAKKIRNKTKEEVVAWRDLTRWQGIATIWISEYGWCIWIAIINAQKITRNMNRHWIVNI